MDLQRVERVLADLDDLISVAVGCLKTEDSQPLWKIISTRGCPMSTSPTPPSTAIEARFYVASSTEHGQPSEKGCKGQVNLSAVSRGDQNKQWASATPSGSIQMTILNPTAFEEVRSWQRAGWDVQVILKPVRILRPEDGHEFRQATHDDAGDYYAREGLCGDCGYMQEQHT